MRRPLPLFLAAFGLILCAAPVFAEEDDLLRPMIVRPTENAPTTVPNEFAPDRPPSRPPIAEDVPMAKSTTLRVPKVSAAAPTVTERADTLPNKKLRVPSLSNSSSLANTATMAPLRSDTKMFSSFGGNTGSAISDKVFKLRDQAINLRGKADQNTASFNDLRGKGAAGSIQYHSTVAAITARLETGTTRGNPILMRQLSEAEEALSEVSYSLSRLTALSTEIAGTSAAASTLAREVKQTRELSGAVDEDHVQLDLIRDEVAKIDIQLDNMRGDVAKDVQRQSTYLSTEKKTLDRLSKSIERGEMIRSAEYTPPPALDARPEVGAPENNQGGMATTAGDGSSALPRQTADAGPPQDNLGSSPPAPILPEVGTTVQPQAAMAQQPPSNMQQPSSGGLGQLLVLVRFNQEVVNYEQPLYQAISDALDRKPDAAFTVVAVAPKSPDKAALQGDQQSAQRHAEAVKASLTQLGLQGARVTSNSISSEAAMVPEVHVYVR
jgi:hypothetical protein